MDARERAPLRRGSLYGQSSQVAGTRGTAIGFESSFDARSVGRRLSRRALLPSPAQRLRHHIGLDMTANRHRDVIPFRSADSGTTPIEHGVAPSLLRKHHSPFATHRVAGGG
jgi:hypothetical protein